MKKLLFILLIIAAFLIIGVVYYFYFYSAEKTVAPSGEAPGLGTTAPGQEVIASDQNKLRRASTVRAVAPVATKDGARVTYLGKTGGIFTVDFNGSNQTEKKFVPQGELLETIWSPSRAEFIAVYNLQGRRALFYNNTATGRFTPLSEGGILSAAFSQEGNQTAYHRSEAATGGYSFGIASPDGTNAQVLLSTRLRDVSVAWPASGMLAVSTTPSGLVGGSLWTLSTASRKLSSALSGVYGLTARWDGAGERLLFSQTETNGRNLALSVSDKTGARVTRLSVQALPEKCVFARDAKSVLCAAAERAPDIVWPDDYYKGLYQTQEQIWRVNLATGQKESLYAFAPGVYVDATDLVLSPDEGTLVFLNRADGFLYSLSLK